MKRVLLQDIWLIGGGISKIIRSPRLLLLPLTLLIFTNIFFSCEKEIIPDPMYDMYEESCGLKKTTTDSVISFTAKFKNYVELHPESVESEYYQPTMKNIYSAEITFNIDTHGWGETITWNFNINEGNRTK